MTDLRIAKAPRGIDQPTAVPARRLAAGLGFRRPAGAPHDVSEVTPPLVATPDRPPPAPAPQAPPATHPPHGVWTAGREHTATLARVAVWLLVLSGPVALGWLATSQQNAAPTAPAAVTAADPGPESAVAAFAEDVAVRWLSATTGPAADEAAGAAPPNAATVTISPPQSPAESGSQLWSVLVAVTGTTAATPPTYVQVPLVVEVAATPDELPAIAALGDPAIVPGPAEAELGSPSAYSSVLPLSDPRAVSAAAFVSALLTGGEVTPLTSPGVAIRAVQPVPASAVEVRTVVATSTEDPERAELALTAALTPALDPAAPAPEAVTATARTATYYLSLTARDGRWEIAALRPGPLSTALPATTRPPADR